MIFIKKLVLSLCISLALLPCVPTHAEIIQNEKTETQKQEVLARLSPYMQLKSKLYDIKFEDTTISNVDQFKDVARSKKDIVRGLTDYNNSNIYVYDDSSAQKNEHVMFHELGHVLDSYDELDNSIFKKSGKYSSTDEFKEIFAEEKNALSKYSKEKYYSDDPCEYFAESYSIYMDFPDLVKQMAPKTYMFINQKVNQQYIEIQTSNKYILDYKHKFFRDNNLIDLDNTFKKVNGDCFFS